MDIASFAAEIERTLKAYKNGDYAYRPQFDADADWAAALSARFADLAHRMAVQSQAAEAVPVEVETEDILQKIVDDVAVALPADTAMLITLAGDEIRQVITSASGSVNRVDVSLDDFRAGLCGWAFREMESVLSPKNKPEARESVKVHQWRTENNIGAMAVVPVRIGGVAVGTLAAMNRLDQRDFTERDVKLLSVMADHVATAMVNARLQHDLRQHSELETTEPELFAHATKLSKLPVADQLHFFLKAAEQSANTIVITDADGYIQYANPKFSETTGYTITEALGQHTRILKSGEMPPEQYKELWETISNGKTWQGEFHNRRKDGTLYWESATISPIKNAAGKITHYLAVKEEITRRKVAEMKLARRATELETVTQVVMQVGTDISRVLDTDELLQKVVDLTKSAFSLYHAHVYVLDDQLLRLVAGAGKIGQQMVVEGWHIPLDHGHSVVARAARSVKPVVLNKVRRGTDFLQNPLLPRTRAELAVPLVVGEDVLGVLDVQADTVGFFSDDDVPVYAALGAQVAVALQNARLFSRVQATLAETEALYNVSRALNTITDLPQLLQTVVEMVKESLSATWTMLVTVDMLSTRIEQKVAVGPNAADILPTSFDDLMAGLGGWALTQTQPILSPKGAPDSRENLDRQQRRLRMGIGAVAIVPLRYQNKSLGVLGVLNPMHGRDFTEQDVNLLTAIGNQVAAAIENRNLLAHTQKRAQQEQSIREVTEKLRAAPNLDILLQTAAEELGIRLGARHAVLELGIDRPPVAQNPIEDGESHD